MNIHGDFMIRLLCIVLLCLWISLPQGYAAENGEYVDEIPMQVIKPNALNKGDYIGIVAPASGIEDMDISDAVQKLTNWGYKVKFSPNLFKQAGYLAGTDDMRAEDLNTFFADDEVKAILCLRGGYGSSRILDKLDYDLIAHHPKMLIGYSDITALHAAIWQKVHMATFHGAMVIDINDSSLNYTDYSLKHGLASENVSEDGVFPLPDNWQVEVLNEGTASGRLIGGNLSVIASLCGTPYELDGTGNILFIEEVSEDSYVIDRMLEQLWQNGLLKKVNGIVVGTLRHCEPTEEQAYDYSVKQVFAHYAKLANIPVLYNMPIGHGPINGFLPLGVKATIKADKHNPQLIIDENYTNKKELIH